MLDKIQALAAAAPAFGAAHGRPFITLSYAQSLDGCITARSGTRLILSGDDALRLTHQLRATHHAIIIGIGTVLTDDPRLTVRLVEGRSPQPVVLDTQLRFPLGARLLRESARTPWIATVDDAADSRRAALEAAGARVLAFPADGDGRVSLGPLMEHLYHEGINSVMIEGGTQVITSFLRARLVDQLVLTIAPVLVGGQRAVANLQQVQVPCLPALINVEYLQLGRDLIVRADLDWSRT